MSGASSYVVLGEGQLIPDAGAVDPDDRKINTAFPGGLRAMLAIHNDTGAPVIIVPAPDDLVSGLVVPDGTTLVTPPFAAGADLWVVGAPGGTGVAVSPLLVASERA